MQQQDQEQRARTAQRQTNQALNRLGNGGSNFRPADHKAPGPRAGGGGDRLQRLRDWRERTGATNAAVIPSASSMGSTTDERGGQNAYHSDGNAWSDGGLRGK